MATSNVTITAAWGLVAADGAWSVVSWADPAVGAWPPDPGDLLAEFAIAASAPAASLRGHILRAGEALTVATVGAGALYARVSPYSGAAASELVVVVS